MLGPMTMVRTQIDAVLDAIIATGGPFDPAATWVGIAQAITPTGIDTVMADITPPTGAAATRQLVVWGTPSILDDGSAVVDATARVFRPAGVETATVAAVFLADALTAGALLAFLMENDFPNLDVDHPYTVVIRLVVDPTGRWSVSFAWNG